MKASEAPRSYAKLTGTLRLAGGCFSCPASGGADVLKGFERP